MLKFVVFISLVASASAALTSNEIESIRSELSDELQRLGKKAAAEDIAKKEVNKKDDNLQLLDELMFHDDSSHSNNNEIIIEEKRSTDCKDTTSDCASFKSYCQTKKFRAKMAEKCPYTCNACSVECKKDDLDSCKELVKMGLCKRKSYELQMKERCFESCGYCMTEEKPACSYDPEGCCWDGETFAKNGCPICEDASYAITLCRNMVGDCKNDRGPGKWMHKHCPVSCKVCDPEKECYDVQGKKEKCVQWKAEGRCESGDLAVRALCRRTCNLCYHENALSKK